MAVDNLSTRYICSGCSPPFRQTCPMADKKVHFRGTHTPDCVRNELHATSTISSVVRTYLHAARTNLHAAAAAPAMRTFSRRAREAKQNAAHRRQSIVAR